MFYSKTRYISTIGTRLQEVEPAYNKNNKTPLPLIGEVIDKLKNTRCFNKLNLIW